MTVVAKPPIIWTPGHPSNAYPDRRGCAFEGVVLHIMDGTAAGCAAWFADPAAYAGALFGTGKDGHIYQYFTLEQGPFNHGAIESGYTAKLLDENPGLNPNWWLVGNEHEGRSGDPIPSAQWSSSVHLTAWLFQDVFFPGGATGVAVDRDHILRHGDISPRTRPNCPGWGEVIIAKYINDVKDMLAPRVSIPPPIVETFRPRYIEELQGIIGAAQDDRVRADVRVATAQAKLRGLGL